MNKNLYQQTYLKLVNQGKFANANQINIDDIRSNMGCEYHSPINEMLNYHMKRSKYHRKKA